MLNAASDSASVKTWIGAERTLSFKVLNFVKWASMPMYVHRHWERGVYSFFRQPDKFGNSLQWNGVFLRLPN